MAHVQRFRSGKWRVRWRDGDRRQFSQTFPTRAAAEARLAEILQSEPAGAHAVRRVDADGEFYVGRYRGRDGQWLETDEFDLEQDALDEARELEADLAAVGEGR